ncbi:polyhydroxyalkanoate synthesis regulator DNA-binding domain-containing protein [Acidisphaera sp. L21]|uniref:polyhydroxyalkanoate synthesis regulator DNA-binding domain-containing protein n=1 Tax=Acidisphaera sp. L21 TaxID=1641851 RepID=UPI00131C929F|nr:polyhydroxyalkanoate synthesis regulator DNA-binding domain-containing protein [Acidisphaera sp. L21]
MPAAIDISPILIKRYGGARLYHPAAGRYVSAETLRSWRVSGIRYTVIDSETGQEVTLPAGA